MSTEAAAMRVRPAAAATAAARGPRENERAAAMANPAPRQSCHARVGKEKNAQGCDTSVSQRERINDAMPKPSTAMAMPATPRKRAASKRTSGQTR